MLVDHKELGNQDLGEPGRAGCVFWHGRVDVTTVLLCAFVMERCNPSKYCNELMLSLLNAKPGEMP